MSLELETETPTFYAWEVPGKPVSIRLEFDVVDEILSEVMQGFGSVPKRGAEVGGVLLGSAEDGNPTVVHIRDFAPVTCEHARGPSYLLSDTDQQRLASVIEHAGPNGSAGRNLRVIGFYRSHTRDGLGLGSEDLALFDRYFPAPEQVFLLVKPYATRPSAGAFFFREEGGLRVESSYREFPFRRRELGGGFAAPERAETAPPLAALSAASVAAGPQDEDLRLDRSPGEPPPVAPVPKRKRNVWIPLSFVFLLLGVLLGFQAAIRLRPATGPAAGRDPYTLSLSAAKAGNTINLRWDRQAPIILKARSGVLTINDGAYSKTLPLQAGQLQNETVIYHYLTNHVKFRLEVASQDRTSISEVIEVHTSEAGK